MPPFATRGFAPCTVLLLDDELSFRSVVQELLELLECKVLVASTGPQALQLAQEEDQTIHLVIADYNLPGMDGVETLTALRRIRPDMKRVLCSGYAEQACLRGRVLEDYVFLAKPFGLPNLRAVLQQARA